MARRPCLLSLSLLEGPPLSLPEIRDLCLPGPGGPLAARLYTPDPAESCGPALIFLHFGGGVLGDLETCHTACTRLARHGGFRVLSLAYRLAPEHPFPAALDHVIHPTLPHAFSAMTGGVPAARAVLTDTARRIRALLMSPKESLK